MNLFRALALTVLLVFMASGYASAAPDNGTEEPILRFGVISDLHVQDWNSASKDKVARALQDISEIDPKTDTLVINGDMGNGLPSDYATLRQLLKKASLPRHVFFTMGNHEYYKAWYKADGRWNPDTFPNGETEEASKKRFETFAGVAQVYYDRWVQGYHFIMLGSERYRQTDDSNREDAWLSPAQLDWLKHKLAEKEDRSKPIFVFLHQPLPGTVAGSRLEWTKRAVVQHEELKGILSQYPQVVFFSGHSHWELSSPNSFFRQGFVMVNTSSVFAPYDQQDVPYDPGAGKSEGVYIEVYKKKLVIRGRNFAVREWVPQARLEVALGQPPKDEG